MIRNTDGILDFVHLFVALKAMDHTDILLLGISSSQCFTRRGGWPHQGTGFSSGLLPRRTALTTAIDFLLVKKNEGKLRKCVNGT
jgi:hypothetical protein